MSRTLDRLLMAIGFMAALGVSAHASPRCLKIKEPFALADDFVSWTMSAEPGSEMHPGASLVLHADLHRFGFEAPTKGAVMSARFPIFWRFRSHEADNFTLVVFEKPHDPEIILDPPPDAPRLLNSCRLSWSSSSSNTFRRWHHPPNSHAMLSFIGWADSCFSRTRPRT